MRVLLVHNRYRFPGGEERHVDLLEQWLPQAGIDTRRFEVTSPISPSLLQQIMLGLSLTYSPSGGRRLRDALMRERPDVVHFHNIFPLLTPAAIREASTYGAKVVLTVHNYRFACPAGTLFENGRIHERCIEGSSLLCGLRNSRGVLSESIAYGVALEIQRRFRLITRWVDAYITPSRFAASLMVRAGYPRDRIYTVPHGVPIADSPSPVGEFALYAGRLSEEKGIPTLVAAGRIVPEVPLVVAGDGELAPMVRRAISDNVTFVGRVDPDEVRTLMRDAAFTLMPSVCYENQPYSALESMAAGTPLIASRLGGLAEIVEDGVTGILAPAGEPQALADAMDRAWSDKARTAEMGARAWGVARRHFGPKQQVAQLTSLYQHLVGTAR